MCCVNYILFKWVGSLLQLHVALVPHKASSFSLSQPVCCLSFNYVTYYFSCVIAECPSDCTHCTLVCVIWCVHSVLSLAGNRPMSSFPGKHCWVRSGVCNYTWVPISSLRAFFPGSPNNTNSCAACRAQPADSQTTHPEPRSRWRPVLPGLPQAMCNPALSFSPSAAGSVGGSMSQRKQIPGL